MPVLPGPAHGVDQARSCAGWACRDPSLPREKGLQSKAAGKVAAKLSVRGQHSFSHCSAGSPHSPLGILVRRKSSQHWGRVIAALSRGTPKTPPYDLNQAEHPPPLPATPY